MELTFNIVSVVSLLTTAVFAALALLVGHYFLGKEQPKIEKWVLSWLVFDALTHFLLEGPFVVISLVETVNSSESKLALLWKEYGKADARWLVSDPTILSLEIITVVLDGALCLLTIYAIITRAYYRHYAQIVLCVCELYGGWMTFCPEWLTGSRSLDTSNAMYLWVYLIFFNMVWVVIPMLLMYQSFLDMKIIYETALAAVRTAPGYKNRRSAGVTKTRKEK